MKVKEIICFANGNTCVFNKKGEQMGTLQRSWLLLYIDFLITKGIEPIGLKVLMPNGKEAQIVKVENGYNWMFK